MSTVDPEPILNRPITRGSLVGAVVVPTPTEAERAIAAACPGPHEYRVHPDGGPARCAACGRRYPHGARRAAGIDS
jgi:hypothetical protein